MIPDLAGLSIFCAIVCHFCKLFLKSIFFYPKEPGVEKSWGHRHGVMCAAEGKMHLLTSMI